MTDLRDAMEDEFERFAPDLDTLVEVARREGGRLRRRRRASAVAGVLALAVVAGAGVTTMLGAAPTTSTSSPDVAATAGPGPADGVTPEEALRVAIKEVVPGATVTPLALSSGRDVSGRFDQNTFELTVPGAAGPAEIEFTYETETSARPGLCDTVPRTCDKDEVLADGSLVVIDSWRWTQGGSRGEQRMGSRVVHGIAYTVRAGEALTVQQVEDVVSADVWARADAF